MAFGLGVASAPNCHPNSSIARATIIVKNPISQLREEQYTEGYVVASEDAVDIKLHIVKRGRAAVYTQDAGEVCAQSSC